MTRKLVVHESVALALSVMSAVAVSLPAQARADAPAVPAVPAGLEVRAGNSAALALYAGLGFEASGRRRGYYSEPTEDAILLAKRRLGALS